MAAPRRGLLILDESTLQLLFALIALVLFVLFFVTFRATRSGYSMGWTSALGFLMLGSSAYLLVGTSHQIWAVPVGHALTVVGLVWAWRAVRSLRMHPLPGWCFVVPAVVVGVATVLNDPVGNALAAGAPLLFAAIAIVMGFAAREVHLLDPGFSRARWSLLLAAALMSAYYFLRLVSFLTHDFGSTVVSAAVSGTTTTVVTMVILISVSFSMAGLSHNDVEQRLRARVKHSTQQLSEGAEVQRRLLPSRALDVTEYPLAGVCVPSQALSGDFFDWARAEGGLYITVGDVMGKGVGAAMLGATVRAGLRIAQSDDPESTVSTVMNSLGSDLVENGSFVTLFHAYLEEESGVLTVLDAGHGLAVIVRRDGSHEQISSVNLPLGLQIDDRWVVQRFTLGPGDRLLVFSDGVLDLFDGSVESMHRAADIALVSDGEAPPMADAVERIAELARASDQDDDVTVVALERLPRTVGRRPVRSARPEGTAASQAGGRLPEL